MLSANLGRNDHSLSRFAEGLPDMQAQPEIAACDECGAEIYDEAGIWRDFIGMNVYCGECAAENVEEGEE
ncbi:hypothetical protein [Salibacterium aidingense]|uniref:hypothetical protein n=1 Tax=Salibacterium aidingense TaxID=384933 RepID=UPI003BC0A7D9